MELFENAFQTGGIRKCWLCVLVWMENILKTKLFKNDGIMVVMIFPCLSFTQTQIRNEQ